MGEPYRDAAGRTYTALIREPVFVYGATLEELRRTHQRALSRELVPAIYIEPMFTTTNDADNRAAVAAAAPDALDFVGIGVHGPRKTHRQGRERAEVPELGADAVSAPCRRAQQDHDGGREVQRHADRERHAVAARSRRAGCRAGRGRRRRAICTTAVDRATMAGNSAAAYSRCTISGDSVMLLPTEKP